MAKATVNGSTDGKTSMASNTPTTNDTYVVKASGRRHDDR